MARPKKATVDYFSHDANSGKTILILESEFGNDGYAFWFKLLEILATTDGHCFRYENPMNKRFLLAKTRVSEDIAAKILDLLAELEAIDKELLDNGYIWSDNFISRLSKVYEKRSIDLPEKPVSGAETQRERDLSTPKPNNKDVSGDNKPQSKVKESKVKKSKGKEPNESKNDSLDFSDEVLLLTDQFKKNVEKSMPGIVSHMKNGFLKEWAAVFDKILRIDKRPIDEVSRLIDHCFDVEKSWWARTKNIRAPAKLRKRNAEGIMYYDVILQEINNGKSKPLFTKSGRPYPSFRAEKTGVVENW